jgi:hypothetical protein
MSPGRDTSKRRIRHTVGKRLDRTEIEAQVKLV